MFSSQGPITQKVTSLLVCLPAGPLEGVKVRGSHRWVQLMVLTFGAGVSFHQARADDVIEAAVVGIRSRREEHLPPSLLPNGVSEGGSLVFGDLEFSISLY